MFKATGNKVVVKGKGGLKVLPVYLYEKQNYAKDGSVYRLMRDKGLIGYGGNMTWYKFYDAGNTQIKLFPSEVV